VIGAVPGVRTKRPRCGIKRCRRIVFQPLEGQANIVAQRFEPVSRARLAVLDIERIMRSPARTDESG